MNLSKIKSAFLSLAFFAVVTAGENSADVSDMYDISLQQAKKFQSGLDAGYYEFSEFCENVNIISEEGADLEQSSGFYFDAALIWFFNGNGRTGDDWDVSSWTEDAATDSDYEFLNSYDLDSRELDR